MSRQSAARGTLAAALILLAACVGVAFAAASPIPPRVGAWKLKALASGSALRSAGFTVTRTRTVIDLHARFSALDGCAGGSAMVKGTLRMKVVTVGNGIREWAVASGRNSSGGLSATPVDLTINGKRQIDATLTIGFPTKTQRGAGELNWGPVSGGIQPCVNAYYVVAG